MLTATHTAHLGMVALEACSVQGAINFSTRPYLGYSPDCACRHGKQANGSVSSTSVQKGPQGKRGGSVASSDKGVVRHRYRKIHLFDDGSLAESKTITGGESLCSFSSGTSPSFVAAWAILRFLMRSKG